jgi:diguanylate cyclase (GGDEF)-like protein
VFHLAVPILDKNGEFYGVLVQQIRTDDLDALLDNNLHASASQIVMHHPSQGISFVYPTKGNHAAPANAAAIAKAITASDLKQGALKLATDQSPVDGLLIGFAESPTFDYIVSAGLPMTSVIDSFLLNNRHLLLYIFFGGLFISYLFFRLYRQYIQLENHQFISRHDALTKLHNRWALNEELPVFLLEAMRSQTPISFLFIDIDHFKNINDTFGHDTGDLALAAVAKAIENCLRRPRDFMCRWGGEEFLVIMPDTSEDSAVMLAEAMMAAVKKIKLKPDDLKITVSIGVNTTYISLENINDEVVNEAEEAMMMAKKNGRDRYFVFTHEQQPSPVANAYSRDERFSDYGEGEHFQDKLAPARDDLTNEKNESRSD